MRLSRSTVLHACPPRSGMWLAAAVASTSRSVHRDRAWPSSAPHASGCRACAHPQTQPPAATPRCHSQTHGCSVPLAESLSFLACSTKRSIVGVRAAKIAWLEPSGRSQVMLLLPPAVAAPPCRSQRLAPACDLSHGISALLGCRARSVGAFTRAHQAAFTDNIPHDHHADMQSAGRRYAPRCCARMVYANAARQCYSVAGAADPSPCCPP